jgi:hypothetical protein
VDEVHNQEISNDSHICWESAAFDFFMTSSTAGTAACRCIDCRSLEGGAWLVYVE